MTDQATAAAPPSTAIPTSPHADEAAAKAVAKNAADVAVATDPNARHAVNLSIKSPKVWASAATGAAVGMAGGPVGALVGGTVGLLVEKHQIGGGPVGKAYDKIKSLLTKKKAV